MKYIYICINKLTKNLKDVDWFTKNDLFVNIKYGKQERRTNVKWNNNQPEWNESFIFEEQEKINEILCEIYDHNMWSPSQILAKEVFKISLDDLKIIKGKYLEIILGDLFYKKDATLDQLTIKNNRLKEHKKHLGNEYKTIFAENVKIKNEMEDLKTLQRQYMKLEMEYIKIKDQYNKTNAEYNKIVNDNSNLLLEKDKILRKNNLTLQENIALNEENILLFEKIDAIKNILN